MKHVARQLKLQLAQFSESQAFARFASDLGDQFGGTGTAVFGSTASGTSPENGIVVAVWIARRGGAGPLSLVDFGRLRLSQVAT